MRLETTIERKTVDDRFTESNLGFQGKRNSQKRILRESFAFYSRHRLKIIPRLQKEGTTMKSVEPTGHHPVDNRWIIRRVTEPPCKLVSTYKRVSRRRDACPSRFRSSFLRTLVSFKRAQRLDPFRFIGEMRKRKKEERRVAI